MPGTDEEWRPVLGFEGLYEVCRDGRVKSLARKVPHRRSKFLTLRERILTQSISATGYKVVMLSKEGRGVPHKVHRILLEAFVGPCPEGMRGLHWDDNPLNNDLSNLRWGTASENARDAVRNGTHWLTAKKACPRNHLLEGSNLQESAARDGRRDCKACARERARAHYHKRDFDPELADLEYTAIKEETK